MTTNFTIRLVPWPPRSTRMYVCMYVFLVASVVHRPCLRFDGPPHFARKNPLKTVQSRIFPTLTEVEGQLLSLPSTYPQTHTHRQSFEPLSKPQHEANNAIEKAQRFPERQTDTRKFQSSREEELSLDDTIYTPARLKPALLEPDQAIESTQYHTRDAVA